MDTIILLPGGGGSILTVGGDPQGVQIWPPTLWEFATQYGKMPQLLDPALRAAGIINSIPTDSLLAWPVYRPLISDLMAISSSTAPNVNFIPFPYDFRKSIFDSAHKLRTTIEACYNSGARSITLVAHSTGNQVARAVLENVKLQAQPWFASLNRYVGICGPHFGVPEVLEYGLGLQGWLSITQTDMQKFSRNEHYPGCYQLFPFQGYTVLDDASTGPEDIYDPTVATQYGLDQPNLGEALKLETRLRFANKPNSVEYHLVAATGQPTDMTINYAAGTFKEVTQNNAGDGTVPLWSAAPSGFNVFITPGDHMGVLASYPFRDYLWMLLVNQHPQTFLTEDALVAGLTGVKVSVNHAVYPPGYEMSVLLIPDKPTDRLVGTLSTDTVDPTTGAFTRYRDQPFAYNGSGLAVDSLRVDTTAPTAPGVYRMIVTGNTHATAPQTTAFFSVTKTQSALRRRR